MLLSLGHGQKIVKLDNTATFGAAMPAFAAAAIAPAAAADAVPVAKVAGASGAPALPAGQGRFGYLFPTAPGPGRTIPAATLDLLGDAMIDQGSNADVGVVPAIFTYFGQFIDHDITANTDNDIPGVGGKLSIEQTNLQPVDRSLVVAAVTNLRNATLRLDSLYGDGPVLTGLEAAMRDGAKMRLGDIVPSGAPGHAAIAPPGDGLADLPRVGPLVQAGVIDPATVPAELLSGGPASESRKALIGDSRNDENLIVAQMHVAFLRFHNAVVDAVGGDFDAAQKLVRHTYQWLVVNAYLPAVADKGVVADVVAKKAPIYTAFFDSVKAQIASGELPMPLEFSAAGFRYGHSLIRAAYDYNTNFTGGGVGGPATFKLLFQFTGNDPSAPIGFGFPKLPDNWPIDWSRFLGRPGDPPFRFGRAIDTALAPPLSDMVNQGPVGSIFRHLAKRNLRRGWILNLPSGQAMADAMTGAGHPPARVLTEAELLGGPIGASALPADEKAKFAQVTPLWYYILREAEVINKGHSLGPVGSRIVAETLVGLAVNDPESYWHEGAGNGKWSPKVGATKIESMEDMLKFAGVLV